MFAPESASSRFTARLFRPHHETIAESTSLKLTYSSRFATILHLCSERAHLRRSTRSWSPRASSARSPAGALACASSANCSPSTRLRCRKALAPCGPAGDVPSRGFFPEPTGHIDYQILSERSRTFGESTGFCLQTPEPRFEIHLEFAKLFRHISLRNALRAPVAGAVETACRAEPARTTS